MSIWYVISEFDDVGDYEITSKGTKKVAKSFFDEALRSEQKSSRTDIRNVTAYQFEVWVQKHYQNDMKPGRAYKVKLTDQLPTLHKH